MMLTRATALVAGATLPLATAIALAPAATAQNSPTTTGTVEVTYTCTPDNALNIGGVNTWTNTVEVTYPTFVSPGEFFEVSIQPGPMQPNTVRVGRITYDIQAPSNADYRTQTLTSGATGITAGSPSLAEVSPTTKATQAGSNTVRIWGGQSARYGTNTGTSINTGLQKNNNLSFQLPEVTFSMRAPNTPSQQIVFGLPGAGAAAATDAASTQFQYTRGTTAGGTGTTGAQVECAASANAAALTTTTITNAPWVPFQWNTNLNVQAQPGALDEDSLAVNVVTSFQRPSNNFPAGTMVTILRDGVEVGQVEMPGSGTTVAFADDIPRTADTQVYRYTAVLNNQDTLGDTWVGTTATSSPVIVAGTNPGAGGGGTGSLDPGSVINPIDSAIGGSLTAGLSGSVGYDVAPLSSPTVTGLLSSAS
ncbi:MULTISPECIES: hypothetical protein [unclassified Dietzia]|uniref:hypothetical protein n=1 Tax=unclassified Dietzia TaxID=2617939 RepID=UPI000D223B38|nr:MULTISPECIES: hypothetical protein [unclassified Dietzia]AVZ40469.1 hypothetical protein CT688_14335 [Dietzia sp. JS16-p6b]MBB1024567.1 hypothetical protein [Dietzia sp. DQ12-76]MBB1028752.1 hypothetical protein [Dietzia sp. DQ11-38-2]QGW25988.1 membrane protein [Dietzia sp. DQ12-45-1b]